MADDDMLESIATGDTIDDFLISLASGVSNAQKTLHEMSQSSGLGVMYQIPQLEFELKLKISTVEQKTARSTDQYLAPKHSVQVAAPSGQDEITAASTIKGSLVAIPVNAGKPKYQMNLIFSETENNNELEILVTLKDSSGSPQQGVMVELNIDREVSYELNKEQGIDQQLHAGTRIKEGVVTTNADGVATGNLKIAAEEKSGILIVVTADALGESKALNYRFG